MWLLLFQAVTVVTSSGDEFAYPQSESLLYEARCFNHTIQTVEEKGTLTLKIAGTSHDLSQTKFYRSYADGSYLGRLAVSCMRNKTGFSVNFFGTEIPVSGGISTASGSITFDIQGKVLDDIPIKAVDINLSNFVKNRHNLGRVK